MVEANLDLHPIGANSDDIMLTSRLSSIPFAEMTNEMSTMTEHETLAVIRSIRFMAIFQTITLAPKITWYYFHRNRKKNRKSLMAYLGLVPTYKN